MRLVEPSFSSFISLSPGAPSCREAITRSRPDSEFHSCEAGYHFSFQLCLWWRASVEKRRGCASRRLGCALKLGVVATQADANTLRLRAEYLTYNCEIPSTFCICIRPLLPSECQPPWLEVSACLTFRPVMRPPYITSRVTSGLQAVCLKHVLPCSWPILCAARADHASPRRSHYRGQHPGCCRHSSL